MELRLLIGLLILTALSLTGSQAYEDVTRKSETVAAASQARAVANAIGARVVLEGAVPDTDAAAVAVAVDEGGAAVAELVVQGEATTPGEIGVEADGERVRVTTQTADGGVVAWAVSDDGSVVLDP